MTIFIIAFIVGAIVPQFFLRDWEARIMNGAVWGLLCLLPATIICAVVPHEWVEVDEVEIVNFQDEGGISGSFFLASGSVGSERYYHFYTVGGCDQLMSHSIRASSARVYMDSESPKYVSYKNVPKDGYEWVKTDRRKIQREIHIPPDSVIREIKIDGR